MPNPVSKPAEYPDWATLDKVDPTSGKNNVATPSQALKDYGPNYKERLARQHFNWLGRLFGGWIRWLEGETDWLHDRVDTEEAARAAADTTLQGNIGTEAATRAAMDASEASIRGTADTTLQGNIDAEASARSTADSNEASARSSADTTLQGNIDTEASTRSAADVVLDGRLDDFDGDTTEKSGTTLELYGYSSNKSITYLAIIKRHRSSNGSNNVLTEVLLWLPETVDTSTDITLGFASASIPSELRPDTDQYADIKVWDNSGGPLCGIVAITASGDWVIKKYDGSSFTAALNKGVAAQLIRYRKSIT